MTLLLEPPEDVLGVVADGYHDIDRSGNLPQLGVTVDFTNDADDESRIWTDVTLDVRELGFQRSGRNHELQRSESGTLTMVLNNQHGDYDPSNASSPYFPGVKRNVWLQVNAKWDGVVYERWTGLVDAWEQNWPGLGHDATVTVRATDVFKILSLFDMDGLDFPEQTTGSRVTAVLGAAGISSTMIDTGQTTLPAVAEFTQGTNALSYLLQVEETENGLLFADRDGQIVFQDRHHRLLYDSAAVGTIGDVAGEIPYRDATFSLDDADVWTEVSVTPDGGTPEVAVALDPAIPYTRRLARSILTTSQAEAAAAAEFLVARYGNPGSRVTALELVPPYDPSADHWPSILVASNSHRFVWRRRADANTIETELHLERAAETVIPGSDWRVTFEMSPADSQSGWVLGDAVLGVLGETTRLVY